MSSATQKMNLRSRRMKLHPVSELMGISHPVMTRDTQSSDFEIVEEPVSVLIFAFFNVIVLRIENLKPAFCICDNLRH